MSSIASGLVTWLAEKISGGVLEQWIRLLLSAFFSVFISTTGVCGLILVQGGTWKLAIGSGLLAGAVSLTALLLRDKQGRSLLLVIPGRVQQEYAKGGYSVTEASKK